jgi:hypothetical protein
MNVYFHMDEGAIALPEGAVDRSTHLLEWKVEGDTVQLGIMRDTNPKRMSPAQLRNAAGAEFERRFPLYQPEEAPPLDIQLDNAVLAFSWKRDAVAVYQLQAFVELGTRAMLFTGTGRTKHRDIIVSVTRRAIESFTLRS